MFVFLVLAIGGSVARFTIVVGVTMVCLRQLLVFPRYTSVTVIVSMGLMSVPITSKGYLQFTSLLKCRTIYIVCSLVMMKG